jgi:hypothetical protein
MWGWVSFFCLVVDRFCAEAVGFMFKSPNARTEGRPPLPRIGKFLMPKPLRAVWRVSTTAARRALLPSSLRAVRIAAGRSSCGTPPRRCCGR